MRKEEDDFDHYYEHMNESERVIYGIYQATSTIDGPQASLHSFFLSPVTEPYIQDIDRYFDVCIHVLAKPSCQAQVAWAHSFSWCGKARSEPPPWMSMGVPR